MKKIVRFVVLVVFTGLSTFYGFNVKAQASLAPDSVTMGVSYANEVYYNMNTGIVLSTPRDQWDIAFRASILSSSIITNDGTGVVLYTYPNSDTNGWATLDTTGLSSWPQMFNDQDDWENGAFSRNATGHPDYGWGIYNSTTHNLKGDSIFIIKLRNESFRKLWIKRKYSSLNTYVFKYAFLDGSDEHEITLDCNPYAAKDYVGYNLAMNVTVDFQPPKTDWDVVFTKYMSIQPNGDPYPVVGVLSNPNVGVGEYAQVGPGYSDWSTNGFDFSRQVIGWDWKVFDMTNFVYICYDSLVYFVQDQPGDIYELIFTKFAGGSPAGNGKIVFGKAQVSLAGVDPGNASSGSVSVYPNPVSDYLNIKLDNQSNQGIRISITDILGKVVYQHEVHGANGTMHFSVPVNDWNPGLYIVNIYNGIQSTSQKLMVK
ncbi:MAG: T9SS type A sorting domain-containing protein [Bacteroidales bacterium]